MSQEKNNTFKGRKPNECKFKVGDIVMVAGCCGSPDYVGIVAALPPSPEFIARHPAVYDEMDDSYLVLTGDGPYIENHQHPHVNDVHPLNDELSEDQLAVLRRGLEQFMVDEKPEKRAGVQLGLEDIEAGRVYHAANAQDMESQILE